MNHLKVDMRRVARLALAMTGVMAAAAAAPAAGTSPEIAAAIGIAATTGAHPPPPSDSGPENIFASTMWDDGRAEFSVYTGTTERYGQPRPTNAQLVVVKEDMLRS